MAKKTTCCNCRTLCGDAPKISPIFVDESDERDRIDVKPWCPACFVDVRAPLQVERWGRAILAVKCTRCQWTSVSIGKIYCPKCGCTRVKPVLSSKAAAKIEA